MEQKRKQREFSMKYCGGLDDYVVVMKTRQNDTQSELCLSAHLCHADERKRCGQGAEQIYSTSDTSYVKM